MPSIRESRAPIEPDDVSEHSNSDLEDNNDFNNDLHIDPVEGEALGNMSEDVMLLGRASKPMEYDHRPRRGRGWITISGFSLPKPLLYLLAIPPLLILINLIASTYNSARPHSHYRHPTLTNGTHPFHPTVLLLSLDGFRSSYLSTHAHLLPNLFFLSSTSKWGLRAESMQPVFPTLTFPNHWSLMTGLYPSSHGIVANDFWDPIFDEKENKGAQFVYTEESKSWDSRWWWGEPIWEVVEKVGRKAAVIMWPGPPVTRTGTSPSYFVPYRNLPPSSKLSQIFAYLDHPLPTRPEFIASYFPEIDQSAHRYGPDAPQVEEKLRMMDEMVGGLLRGLEERNLNGVVDLLIVSDHGMTSTSNERIIYLDDILGEDGVEAIEHKDGWPSVGLRFSPTSNHSLYLSRLLSAAENSNGTFAVYTPDTMPQRWHFTGGRRIAPIYVVPDIGWAVTDRHEHEVLFQGDYQPRGNHGYDNKYSDMQAIFFAHGPVARTLKDMGKGFISHDPPVLHSFKNLEIFSLVTRLLSLRDVEPGHNGTIGFWEGLLD
ncbi:type I phosphodiesterase/nucleotide pyrophosphatase family protein [Cryptococcus neoformans Tu401-1]|nr:type I phosphodiesterase/nucleotide pyrophosphatase family protein [Cryptococcus neoformans var. grubii Tu401-1]OXM80481.1 type I phosphodiesterase/nucleotide pyrophosphatase family protein [Cryptococcus neoformans var. grubii Bt63]